MSDELERIRKEYANRERRFAGRDTYTPFNRGNLFIAQQRQRSVIDLLKKSGRTEIGRCRLLELGCGRGGVLLEFLSHGARPENLHGADLLPDRVRDARLLFPHFHLTCADGQTLPYMSGVFDLVMQFTVFSSVLDDAVKTNLAHEMMRVLKPGGFILWYDFWLNPTNPQTRGIRPPEIRRLFPDCEFEFHRITLAPPLTRKIVPISWTLALVFEKLQIFNTHYLVAIRPQ